MFIMAKNCGTMNKFIFMVVVNILKITLFTYLLLTQGIIALRWNFLGTMEFRYYVVV